MFTFFNYSSLFLNIVYVFNLRSNFKICSHVSINVQNLFTCFDKCSKFVQYLKILFTLSNIAQFFITLFIFSKRMIENSEKDRISDFTFFTSLHLFNVSRTRQAEWLARMVHELEVGSSIPTSV